MIVERDGQTIHKICVKGPPDAGMNKRLITAAALFVEDKCFPDRLDDPDYWRTGQMSESR